MRLVAYVSLCVVSLLCATFFIQQHLRWMRIARAMETLSEGRLRFEVARAAAAGDSRLAWVAVGLSWIAMIAILMDLK